MRRARRRYEAQAQDAREFLAMPTDESTYRLKSALREIERLKGRIAELEKEVAKTCTAPKERRS